jgi:hypothetical protein
LLEDDDCDEDFLYFSEYEDVSTLLGRMFTGTGTAWKCSSSFFMKLRQGLYIFCTGASDT